MNIFISILSGIIIGIIIGLFLKKSSKKISGRATMTPDRAGQAGFISESVEKKGENLQKAKAFIKGKAKITNDELQKELGVSDATIVRYLNDLESEGLIKQVGKTGQAVYYEVN